MPSCPLESMRTGTASFAPVVAPDRKSTRLNSHLVISYAVFCLKKKKEQLRASGSAPPDPTNCASTLKPKAPTGSQLLLFFFNDTATTEIYTLSLHDALPI